MDVSYILDQLNDPQREAVTSESASGLILAGAGSGKTRVLVHRIAWLLSVERQSNWSILAVTFTNKAAREMRGRIEELLGKPVGGMWVGTFHGLAHRLLRAHWDEAGLPKEFQILDSDDQFRLIKRLLKQLQLDDKKWPPRQIQHYINSKKDEGLRAAHIDDEGAPYEQQMVAIYREYEQACQRGGLVDFAELLLRAHELWLKRPDVLEHYRKRFTHVLVDEFQDTNAIQYAWLRLLTQGNNNLLIVGDDDQSIYGWRGAKIENIRQYQEHYPQAAVIKLEQNYRSTSTILSAANALIGNNPSRLGKELWTDGEQGNPIYLYTAFNEIDEARFVIDQIRAFSADGHRRDECAILYRSNAQSRLFEEALLQQQIPYRVYGGLRFFERAEIKDAMAYLRLLANRHDDAGFERAVNQPPRGIGPKTLDGIRAHGRDFSCSLWQATIELLKGGRMTARAGNALQGFVDLIEKLDRTTDDLPLYDRVEAAIDSSKLIEHFKKSRDGKGEDRIENLEELINASRQYTPSTEEDLPELSAFISHSSLEAGEGQADAYEDSVQLMTLHSAKGLEFPLVFLVGLEEDLFPHKMSASDPERLEEERRLCYVGITRAMQQLYICHAESRRLHGSETYPMASRFIREIPEDLISEIRSRPGITQPHRNASPTPAHNETGISLGQRVSHPKFGEGIVLNTEGSGKSARVQVNFETTGTKWLVLAYANLST